MATMSKKETEILNYISKLGISREEAEQLWEDDNSDEVLPEVAEMEKKVKENGRMYVSDGDKSKKSRKPKERKVDEEKKAILDAVSDSLPDDAENITVKTETEISFDYNGSNYTLKLTRHKKKE